MALVMRAWLGQAPAAAGLCMALCSVGDGVGLGGQCPRPRAG